MNRIWQNEFNWNPNSCVLINKENDNIQIDLVDQRKAHLKELNIEIHPHVQFKKQLNYDIEAGWSWHKSWNLPEFDYFINDLQTKDQTSEGTLYVQIFVVKALEKPQQYKNLGIKGESIKQIKDKQANFKCLKFTTTSYNNYHKKFHLMIVLFYSSVNEQNVVLSSIISPEIFVDSRKYARFRNVSVHQNSFTELFSYQLLDSIILKRETKNKTLKIIKIENSIIGFINYFTASNIRNKIKHPIFLALRFSKIIKLFVHQQMFYSSTNIVTQIQHNLNDVNTKLENQKKIKILIQFYIDNNILQRKAFELIQQLENNFYEIYTQRCYLPNNVREIQDLKQLTLQYEEHLQQSEKQINQTQHFEIIKVQSLLQAEEDNVKQKVKIEQFPDTKNNLPSQIFKDINVHRSQFDNSIKKEEEQQNQYYTQQNIYQQYVPFVNINQNPFNLESYQMQFYQNQVPLVHQLPQNYYMNPFTYSNPYQNMWKYF